jgi:catechol 2,3-dioxygenase-like lactoylglutathione lyase family enzyme
MDIRIEPVSVPVTDIDRAIRFYTEQVGFNLDHDHQVSDEIRFVQITPAGSACSILVGHLSGMEPGTPARAAVRDPGCGRRARAPARGRRRGARCGRAALGPVRHLRRPGRQHLGLSTDRPAGGLTDGALPSGGVGRGATRTWALLADGITSRSAPSDGALRGATDAAPLRGAAGAWRGAAGPRTPPHCAYPRGAWRGPRTSPHRAEPRGAWRGAAGRVARSRGARGAEPRGAWRGAAGRIARATDAAPWRGTAGPRTPSPLRGGTGPRTPSPLRGGTGPRTPWVCSPVVRDAISALRTGRGRGVLSRRARREPQRPGSGTPQGRSQ